MAETPHVVRLMTPADLPEVARLEQSAGDVRWSEDQLRVELAKAIARYFIALVPDGRIAGYVGGWVISPELQIANIVIHPEFRCRGIGRHLLETLLAQARTEGCTLSTLEVRRGNAHAQALYRAAGYRDTGTRPRAYQHPDEDAILMEKSWS